MLQSNGPAGHAWAQYGTCWRPPHTMSLHHWPHVPVMSLMTLFVPDNSQGREEDKADHWLQKNADGG